MPRCRYPKCNKEFVPNIRNRGRHKQYYCCNECRYKDWDRLNPRVRQHPQKPVQFGSVKPRGRGKARAKTQSE